MSASSRPSRANTSLALSLTIGGGILLAAGLLIETRLGPLLSMVSLLIGAAMLVIGGLSLFVIRATSRSYEWLIAWRYLRARRASTRALWFLGVLLLIGAGLQLASYVIGRPASDIPGFSSAPASADALRQAAFGVFAVSAWAGCFAALQLFFSVFTSISIMGVFFGTEVLVVVLSVMGGFEQDLRSKILGARAHVVVSRPRAAFTDYRRVLPLVDRTSGVRAVSPFLEGEVMITSQSNLEGVKLRGIEPRRFASVTQIKSFLRAEGGSGSLRYLDDPQALARRPSDGGGFGLAPKLSAKDSGERNPPPAGASQPASRPTPSSQPDGTDYRGAGPPVAKRPVYPGLLVGAELARNLRLYVGDDVNLIAPLGGMSPAGPIPRSRPFRVAGIFYSGMYEFDSSYVYALLPETQRFLGFTDEISGIEVKVVDAHQVAAVTAALKQRLPSNRYEVKDWRQLNAGLFSALLLEKVAMFFVLVFVVVVAALAIIITLTMIVLQKTREIAALRAVGASRRGILRIFCYAGLYIGIIGMAIGVLQGVGLAALLARFGWRLNAEVYYISQLPVRIDATEITAVAISAVLLSFLGTLYPALAAARLKPVEGLRAG
ncbi:MAG: FtsX-like permease family protein [Deltaproteobacteria bacterium]|nr:FtsX-like permease family protein [Deltaproteobacteria bacterium]